MATRTVAQLAPTNSSDANFRLWINEIHNALIAFGWVQTADTGQINFSTVLAPAGINTYPGFAVYGMDDTLQATVPVYMRIDFGEGAVADSPSILVIVTLGGTTDGAGTIIGNATTQFSSATGSKAASATLASCYTSGDSGSFRMHFWGSELNSAAGWTLVVERERNTAGVVAGTGVHVAFHWNFAGNSTSTRSQFLEADGSAGSQDSIWYALLSLKTSHVQGGIVGVAPVRTQLGPLRQPMLGLFLVSRTDFVPAPTTYPLTIYGATHRYIILRPNAGSGSPALNSINADTAFGMLWE